VLSLLLGPLVATFICIGTMWLSISMTKAKRQVRDSLFAVALIVALINISVGFLREYPSELATITVIKFIATMGVIGGNLVILTLALIFEPPFADSLKASFREIIGKTKLLFMFQIIISSITLFAIWSAELSVTSLDGAFTVNYPPFYGTAVLTFIILSLAYVALILGRRLETVKIEKLSSRAVNYVYIIIFSIIAGDLIVLIVNFFWVGTTFSIDAELIVTSLALAIVTYSFREILEEQHSKGFLSK